MDKKSFGWWFVFVLLFIWQILQNIVAVLMIPFLGKLELIACRHYSFAFKAKNMLGGISLGSFCFLDSYLATKDTDIAHELDGHTVDSKIFGPLYLFIIGLPSILNAAFDFTEKWANKHAGLGTDENCRLIWKK